ncbi:MAG TPA: GNAT family N-acetyltransferase [Thermoanaerobaculia bacterium]|nr:GNAT family N-acetyltransferase [Thermoanaerobaculia bacterium]
MHPLADLTLSRRLERCEGRANAAIVDARAQLQPDAGAAWIERAGAFAMFDGVGSPLTQTFGLGIFETPAAADLDAIEEFFTSHGAATFHEVSPIADFATVNLLTSRGYRVVELTSVMYQPIAIGGAAAGTRVIARPAEAHEVESYARLAAEGWSELTDVAPLIGDLARVSASAQGATVFFAEADGRAIATGALVMHDGVALLAGAATIPSARRMGAQRALLEARLRFAAERGCDLAMMCAAPGSASQRNAERQGFRIAYTRIKWGR